MVWGTVVVALAIAGVVAIAFLLAEMSREKREISLPPSAQRPGAHDTLVSHWEASGASVDRGLL
jgi:hypothetical protein